MSGLCRPLCACLISMDSWLTWVRAKPTLLGAEWAGPCVWDGAVGTMLAGWLGVELVEVKNGLWFAYDPVVAGADRTIGLVLVFAWYGFVENAVFVCKCGS